MIILITAPTCHFWHCLYSKIVLFLLRSLQYRENLDSKKVLCFSKLNWWSGVIGGLFLWVFGPLEACKGSATVKYEEKGSKKLITRTRLKVASSESRDWVLKGFVAIRKHWKGSKCGFLRKDWTRIDLKHYREKKSKLASELK